MIMNFTGKQRERRKDMTKNFRVKSYPQKGKSHLKEKTTRFFTRQSHTHTHIYVCKYAMMYSYMCVYHDPENHNDVITHLEPDILECEVK